MPTLAVVNPLPTYIAAWRSTAADLQVLFAELASGDWSRPTQCPGWSVFDVAAHLAAIEAELAGEPPTSAGGWDGGPPSPRYTQAGVDARRGRSPDDVIDEFRAAVVRREASLVADPPDPAAPAPMSAAGRGWDWETLLRNRVIDLWVHEQDIREATGRPGDLDTPGAQVTLASFSMALPYVVAKKAAAPIGTSVLFEVSGPFGFTRWVIVDDGGRGVVRDPQARRPSVSVTTDTATFARLCAGRIPAADEVSIDGDPDLAARLLTSMNMTP
jgi:uncharacterized protein (TIGR03083 family)